MRPPDFPVTRINQIHFKNPFVVLSKPTPLTNPNGRVTPDVLMYYKSLARSEAALVIAGPATVVPPNTRKFSLLRVDQPKYLDGLRALSKIIHSNGSIAGIQVTHPGIYEANHILKGTTSFGSNIEDFHDKKLQTAFRNACQRSLEVGFRYVELDAAHFLLLHQLLEADREELLRAVFTDAIEALKGEGIVAVRFYNVTDLTIKYGSLFLELGGDLICLETPDEGAAPFDGKLMACMDRPLPSAHIRERLASTALFGMSPDFKNKHQQIVNYFRGV